MDATMRSCEKSIEMSNAVSDVDLDRLASCYKRNEDYGWFLNGNKLKHCLQHHNFLRTGRRTDCDEEKERGKASQGHPGRKAATDFSEDHSLR